MRRAGGREARNEVGEEARASGGEVARRSERGRTVPLDQPCMRRSGVSLALIDSRPTIRLRLVRLDWQWRQPPTYEQRHSSPPVRADLRHAELLNRKVDESKQIPEVGGSGVSAALLSQCEGLGRARVGALVVRQEAHVGREVGEQRSPDGCMPSLSASAPSCGARMRTETVFVTDLS